MESRAISTVDKVLDVLQLFNEDRYRVSIEDIQRELNLPQSTVYRYVRLLVERGFLDKVDSGYYHLGVRLIVLSRIALHSDRDIRLLSLPSMKRVADHTGESVSLMRIANQYAVCIESIEGQYALRVTIEPGRTQLLHAGASSKVLLAYSPESKWSSMLRLPLKRFTETTITDMAELKQEARKIRQQGYSISNGEIDIGARAIAVPLLNRQDEIIAALSIEAPSSRMPDEVVADYAAILQQESEDIRNSLN
ncbi:MAG: IclR family transcriptional regulator [Anaerolineae bacterium]|nr:IclR family transcriptional regulator [Anaerolineae bacterium]